MRVWNSQTVVFVACVLPFLLNDLAFIFFDGTFAVYVADYASRCVVLALLVFWQRARDMLWSETTTRPDIRLCLIAILVLPVLDWATFRVMAFATEGWPGFDGLFRYGRIENPALYVFDLTIGLLLVAITEELVFRKLAFIWLRQFTGRASTIIFVSACIFALIHWGNGFTSVAGAFVVGAMFMSVYMKLRRVWPLVIAHWITNFGFFGPLSIAG